MARVFVSASSEYFISTTTPVTAAPLTMACWHRTTASDTDRFLISIAGTNTNRFGLETSGGGAVRATTRSGSFGAATATTAYSQSDVFEHSCGVWTASNNRIIYFNGVNEDDNGTDITPTVVRVGISCKALATPEEFWDGAIAEAAIWNVALNASEVAFLANSFIAGVPPLVRRGNLVSYTSLVDDADNDIMGGVTWTVNGTPTVASHVPIIQPEGQIIPFPAAAAASTGSSTSLMLMGVGN